MLRLFFLSNITIREQDNATYLHFRICTIFLTLE